MTSNWMNIYSVKFDLEYKRQNTFKNLGNRTPFFLYSRNNFLSNQSFVLLLTTYKFIWIERPMNAFINTFLTTLIENKLILLTPYH